jgi:hypothetical protein
MNYLNSLQDLTMLFLSKKMCSGEIFFLTRDIQNDRWWSHATRSLWRSGCLPNW